MFSQWLRCSRAYVGVFLLCWIAELPTSSLADPPNQSVERAKTSAPATNGPPNILIERKRDKPFFVVASFINPHDICFAYSAYKGRSPKGKQSVEHLYGQAVALPLDELPPLPDNYAIQADEPHAIESNLSPRAVTPAGTMRKEVR